MKAILVIDLPDNLNKAIDEIRVDIKARLYGDEILDWRNQSLKPLPHKKNKIKELPQYTKEYEAYCKGEVDGYNQCIDEILGEENEVYR